MPQNKSIEEVNLLLKELRDGIQDVFVENANFDNNFYLYRWLLQNKMNVKQTAKAIRESIEWRKTVKVDELVSIEWCAWCPEMNTFGRQRIGGFTKTGQPITTIDCDEIDVRAMYQKCGKEGHVKGMIQYFAKVEKCILDHYKYGPGSHGGNMNSLNSNPHNVANAQSGYNPSWDSAGAILIATYKNFPMKNATYVEGIQGFLEGSKLGMSRFPALISTVYLINLNPFSTLILNMVKPLIKSDSFNLEILGTDKTKWSKVLLEHIDADQLQVYFGGNMVV